MVSAIVLAAGLSKRMGKLNKLLLPYNGQTIIAHSVNSICNAGIEEIIVVTGYESDNIEKCLRDMPVKTIYNPRYEEGITTSIQCGVGKSNGSGYMICLGDMVKIISVEYELIKETFEANLKQNEDCILVPRYNNIKGNPVVFSSSYKEKILRHTEMNGCSEIVRSNNDKINWIDMRTDHVLCDIDLYEDYENLNLFPKI